MEAKNKNKIKSFTDSDAWKEAHKLVLIIYKIAQKFPREELFGLAAQMKSAAVSISSNIAEGFSRFSNKDKHRFYLMAQGSLTEIQNQLLVARDVNYIDREEFKNAAQQLIKVHKLINGLKKIKDK